MKLFIFEISSWPNLEKELLVRLRHLCVLKSPRPDAIHPVIVRLQRDPGKTSNISPLLIAERRTPSSGLFGTNIHIIDQRRGQRHMWQLWPNILTSIALKTPERVLRESLDNHIWANNPNDSGANTGFGTNVRIRPTWPASQNKYQVGG